MKRKRIRKKIESLKDMIEEHKRKIEAERQASFPDKGLIAHWEKEITNFRNQIEKTMKKEER